MPEVGRPTELTIELTTKIRRLVLDGWEYIKIQAELGIASGTWDHWVFTDYQGFRTALRGWKQEKMVKKAENVIDELTDSEDEDIRYKSASFILETLDKNNYSKRQEMTGKNGKNLIPQEEVEEELRELRKKCDTQPATNTGFSAPSEQPEVAETSGLVQLPEQSGTNPETAA